MCLPFIMSASEFVKAVWLGPSISFTISCLPSNLIFNECRLKIEKYAFLCISCNTRLRDLFKLFFLLSCQMRWILKWVLIISWLVSWIFFFFAPFTAVTIVVRHSFPRKCHRCVFSLKSLPPQNKSKRQTFYFFSEKVLIIFLLFKTRDFWKLVFTTEFWLSVDGISNFAHSVIICSFVYKRQRREWKWSDKNNAQGRSLASQEISRSKFPYFSAKNSFMRHLRANPFTYFCQKKKFSFVFQIEMFTENMWINFAINKSFASLFFLPVRCHYWFSGWWDTRCYKTRQENVTRRIVTKWKLGQWSWFLGEGIFLFSFSSLVHCLHHHC